MKTKWAEIGSRTRSFRLGSEPELIHIIKTGYSDTFMVVDETGYDMMGDLKIMSSKQILENFGIDIREEWAEYFGGS